MVAKALVKAIVDSEDLQLMKLSLNGETHSEVERIQPYGLTSIPPEGAQAVVLFLGGNRDNPVVIAADDGRVRVKVEPGEVAMYSEHGNRIVLKADGSIEVTPASGQRFKVNGIIEATDVWAGSGTYSKLLSHTHPETGSVTGAPNLVP